MNAKITLVLMVVLAWLAASCNPQPGSAGDPEIHVLRVWANWGRDELALQTLLKSYPRLKTTPIELTLLPSSEIEKALAGGNPPDLIVLSDAQDIVQWHSHGWLQSIDRVIPNTDINLADLYPLSLSYCRFNDQFYCLPWGADFPIFYWNKDLFEQAGLDPESPPRTFSELKEFSPKFIEVDSHGRYTRLGFIPDYPSTHIKDFLTLSGAVQNLEMQPDFNSPAFIDLLSFEQSFYQTSGAAEVSAFRNELDRESLAGSGFADGKVAMLIAESWQAGPNGFTRLNPSLRFGAAPLPYPDGNPLREGTVRVSGPIIAVPSAAASSPAADRLLAWMVSPQTQADWSYATMHLPVSMKAGTDARMLENEHFPLLMDLFLGVNAVPDLHGLQSNAWIKTLEIIEQRVLAGEESPHQIIDEMQELNKEDPAVLEPEPTSIP